MEQKPTQLLVQKMAQSISRSLIENERKNDYVASLMSLNTGILEQAYLFSEKKITNLDMRYLICFVIDMKVEDISLLFHVQPASVRTVRYRIKKKFGDDNQLKLLI